MALKQTNMWVKIMSSAIVFAFIASAVSTMSVGSGVVDDQTLPVFDEIDISVSTDGISLSAEPVSGIPVTITANVQGDKTTSGSTTENTLVFNDDFESGTVSKWIKSTWYSGSILEVTTAQSHSPPYSFHAQSNPGTNSGPYIMKFLDESYSHSITETKFYLPVKTQSVDKWDIMRVGSSVGTVFSTTNYEFYVALRDDDYSIDIFEYVKDASGVWDYGCLAMDVYELAPQTWHEISLEITPTEYFLRVGDEIVASGQRATSTLIHHLLIGDEGGIGGCWGDSYWDDVNVWSVSESQNTVPGLNSTCTVSFYQDSIAPENLIDFVSNVFVPADGEVPASIDWMPIAGEHDMIVVVENVNPTDRDITNNVAIISVSVSEPGIRPVVDAGPDQTVDVGQAVQFDGTGSYFPDAPMVNVVTRTVDISGNGKYMAIGWATNISFFATSSNRPLWTYDTGKRVAWVVLSEDGRSLATAQNDIPENTWQSRGYVSLFDTAEGTPQWTAQTDYPVSPQRKSLDITRDGSRIIAGTYLELPQPDYRQKVGSVYLFDSDSPTPTDIHSFPKSVMGVKFSGDGNYFAAGSYWYELRFYSVTNGLMWTKTSSDPFYTVGLDFDASHVSSSQGSLKRTYLYNNVGSQLWYAASIGGAVTMEMSDDGQFFASAEYSKSAFRLFSTSSSSPLWSYQPPDASRATMDMSKDGQYMVGGTFLSNLTYLFSKESGIPVFTHSADGNVWDTSCSYDGEYFASVTESGTLYLFTTVGTPGLVWQWSNAQPAPGYEMEYSWDFDAAYDSDGDGDPANDMDATGPTPALTYYVPGVYTVTLTVTAPNGLSATDTMVVTVVAPEPAALVVEKVKLSGIDEGFTHTYYEWELLITVTNDGGSDALDVIVNDVLPAELELLSMEASMGTAITENQVYTGTRATPAPPTTQPVKSTHITWDVGILEPGQSATLYLKVCTRLNPAEKQEFTSPGTYIINEGAYAEGTDSLTGEYLVSEPATAIQVVMLDYELEVVEPPRLQTPKSRWFLIPMMFACFLPGYKRKRGDSYI